MATTNIHELNLLLEEPEMSVLARGEELFDQYAGPWANALVLAGAGVLGRLTLAGLRKAGVVPLAFADNNSALWGTSMDGLPVYSVQEAAQQFGRKATFVTTAYTVARFRKQLRELGLRTVPFAALFLKFPDVFLPHACLDYPHKVMQHRAEIREAFSLWGDEASQREFIAQVRYRLAPTEYEITGHTDGTMHFPEDLVRSLSSEVFVDCGAFDGDSQFSHDEGRGVWQDRGGRS